MAGNIIDQWFAAASVEENYKTMHVWDGDGNASRVFEINFQGGYINQADVKSFMVNKTTQARTDLTVKFTGTNTVTLSQAVPVTHQVTIYRDTNKTAPLAAFADGAIITALNLDRNAKQAVFAVAEMVDRFDSVTATAQDAIATAYSALDKANTAISTANGAVSTANDAKSAAAGAVTAAGNAVSTANAAKSTAESAKATAEGIDAKVNQAVSTANAANTTAGEAKSTANGIDAKATQALNDSATAKTNAATAVDTANGVDAKATQALSKATTADANAKQALDAVNASAGNFDKIWATITTIDGANSVYFKKSVSAASIGLLQDGKTSIGAAWRWDGGNGVWLDVNPSLMGSDPYLRADALSVRGKNIQAFGGRLRVHPASDGAKEFAIRAGDTDTVGFERTSNYRFVDFGSMGLHNTGGISAIANFVNKGNQGAHLVWNEDGDGRGAIVVNRGGGTGGFNFRFVNAQNSVETGSFRMDGAGSAVLTGNIQAGDVVARGTVYAGGGGNGRMAADGNVYGTRWGGWAYDWIVANAMTDFGRGGQQYRGSARDAWEAPAGCVVTGRNNNVGDGRDQGIYFRQLIGRKINGGQFGVGDFG